MTLIGTLWIKERLSLSVNIPSVAVTQNMTSVMIAQGERIAKLIHGPCIDTIGITVFDRVGDGHSLEYKNGRRRPQKGTLREIDNNSKTVPQNKGHGRHPESYVKSASTDEKSDVSHLAENYRQKQTT